MALPPKFAGQKQEFTRPAAAPASSSSGVAHTTHTIELFWDYCCPFSAKMFKTLNDHVVPKIKENHSWANNVALIFRQQVQPWHPSSTLMHEAGLAVLQLAPETFWEFSAALFAEQGSFFDVSVVNETRNETYRRLAKLAASSSAGVDEDKVFEKLRISDKPAEDGSKNVGNAVTNDLKLITKMNRLVGVHVTPTVLFDGVVQNDISSSWSADQWTDWLRKNVG